MVDTSEDFGIDSFEPAQPQGHPNLLRVAWQRKSLILLGLVAGLVLGALYYAQCVPVYQSGTQVLVVKKRPDVLPIEGSRMSYSAYEDYLATHMVLIRSPVIVGRAVKKHNLGSLKSFEGQGDPTGAIIGSITAARDQKDAYGMYNNILNISYKGIVPEDCGTILNAVVDSYKDFLEETYRNVSEDAVQLITKAQKVLEKDLAEKQEAYRKFRLETPLLWKGKDGTNIHQERLSNIEAKRSALLVRQAELRGRLKAVEDALKAGRSRAELVQLLYDPSKSTSPTGPALPNAHEDDLVKLRLEIEVLRQDYGPDHPLVKSTAKRINVLEGFLLGQANARSGLGDDKGKGGNLRLQDPVEYYVQSLRHELQDLRTQDETLTALFKEENDATQKLIKDELQETMLREDIAQTKQLYDSIVKSLQQIDILQDFGGYDAKVISPPGRGFKVEPKQFPIFSMAAFLGLLGGVGLAYLAEISDKSFRTPEEIRRRLGLPVVGHIPFLRQDDSAEVGAEGAALDPVLVAFHRPKSTESEAYRGVRTALYFSTRGEGHKVIQVTSPNKSDGKSTLAANLAISIAQSGKRTILLDADFRKPRQHKVFGLSPKIGLASLVAGEVELPEAVQESGVPGLSLLPCGPIPPNPAELLTSPRFKEVLDLIREQYDFVLVDTPPVLAVTDPCVVAPRVDGVLLVVRVSKNGRPHAERAKEILATLGAKVLGVVVNGVGKQGGYYGYGYGSYRYGYSPYAYNYGYGYGYGNESYYAEDPESEGKDHAARARSQGTANGEVVEHAPEEVPGSVATAEGNESLLKRWFKRR